MTTQIQQNKYHRSKCLTSNNKNGLRSSSSPFSSIPRHPFHIKAPERKRTLPKEISLIMILLAVRTASEISLSQQMLSLELIASSHSSFNRPLIDGAERSNTHSNSIPSNKYASFTEFCSDSILTSTMSSCCSSRVVDHEDPGDQSEEFKVGGDTLEPDEKLEDTLFILPNDKFTSQCARFATNEAIWENIFSYMTWREALHTREVSRFHYLQSIPFACLIRMPSSNLPAVFIPCRFFEGFIIK